MNSPILIIGAGLAGLTAAIHLRLKGVDVMLIEKNRFPHHKVCGEYISNEVLPYLDSLGLDVFELGAKAIDRMAISTREGKLVKSELSLGGFGISRHRLDKSMHDLATSLGVQTIYDTVTDCRYSENHMVVTTREGRQLTSPIVIGAYGKRSSLDKKLDREYLQEDASFLAVKSHYKGKFPDKLVALHNFKGGYCGISRVEEDLINVCYITDFKSFKKHKDITSFQENIIQENPHLDEFFLQATPAFDSPLTISQISFAEKQRVTDHILMCGDSAGLIHPLCGNGMSMAIRGAKILSETILTHKVIDEETRNDLEEAYLKAWGAAFNDRLQRGRQLARLFSSETLTSGMMIGLKLMPGILPRIIASTHGHPLTPLSA